jgi:chondroitin AC lyase
MESASLRRAVALVALGSFFAPSAGSAQTADPEPDIARAVRQFREFYLGSATVFEMRSTNESPVEPQQASRFLRSQRPDGTWGDLDYGSTARSGWPPANHLARTVALVAVAQSPGTAAADRGALLAAAHRAFAFWIAHDLQSTNWWYNEIGVPDAIGTMSLLLGDQRTPAEFRYATRVSLARFPVARTGQNRVWLAGNALKLGLLTGDPARLQAASAAIWSEVRVTAEEGIQADFSFHQHGPQQQFGNYGMAFAVETARYAEILRGTPWQLPPDRRSVFSHYLLDGQNWVSWRGALDISACGRQLMPGSPREKTANLARVMERAARFDPANAPAYADFVARNEDGAANRLVGNRFFWRSDYLVHRQPQWAATVKLSSNRVIGTELVNSENLSGYHLADGASYFYRDGAEYADIFPVWDWRKLPGVTCAQVDPPRFQTSSVPADFVGGVSDGRDGCCALDYRRDGVRARKAWFAGGDGVICLGADIGGDGAAPIATTLNQCLLRGPVRITAGGRTGTLGSGSHALSGIESAEHDGWRYTLLDAGRAQLAIGPASGSWRRVFDNPDSPAPPLSKEVFTLWLDHGRNPAGAHYAYAVSPSGGRLESRVLENSAARQSVALGDGKVGVICWAPGEFNLPDGRRLGVSEPCLLLVGAERTLVVDPTQKLRSITLAIDGRARAITLPTGPFAGTAAIVEMP